MDVFRSDLEVDKISDCLKDVRFDWIVSGSIGSVESPRLVRALRRLGASVQTFLTRGAQTFITDTSLHWASAQPCVTSFTGKAQHLAENDALVIAPASAQFTVKISLGVADDPASCLAQSYLGQRKPIFILPAMHGSLALSPGYLEAVEKLKPYCTFLSPRDEEGRFKVGHPEIIADRIAHLYKKSDTRALLNMGTTRAYLDDVRYVSNYSSGGLGSLLAEELYRHGIQTTLVCGPSEIKPRTFTKKIDVETPEDMLAQCVEFYNEENPTGVFLLASVLDYVPTEKQSGKLPSGRENLQVQFKPTEKIIGRLTPRPKQFRMACKLLADFSDSEKNNLKQSYIEKHALDGLLINLRKDVTAKSHAGLWIARSGDEQRLTSKADIARFIVQQWKKANS